MELITHSGPFQADDAFAYAMLTLIFPKHVLIRSRDPRIVSHADPSKRVIFDVGGVYNQHNYQFDHHYESAQNLPRYNEKSVAPMSACGLIYKTFHKTIIREIMGDAVAAKIDESFYDLVYSHFIHDFDAVDKRAALEMWRQMRGEWTERRAPLVHQLIRTATQRGERGKAKP